MSKVKYKDKTYVGTPSLNGVELVGNKNPNEFGLANLLYPIGTFFESSDANFNPNTYFGGTWTEISGRSLVSANDTDSTFKVDKIGGTADIPVLTHTHSTDAQGAHSRIVGVRRADSYKSSSDGISSGMPWNTTVSIEGLFFSSINLHNYHGTSTSTGQSGIKMNLPPYIIIKCWYRTA